jgi:hypothetical protein
LGRGVYARQGGLWVKKWRANLIQGGVQSTSEAIYEEVRVIGD